MNGRKFGVELEFSTGGLGRDGIEELMKSKKIPFWSIDYDGSDVELSTVPLRGVVGLRKLEYIMEVLRDAGCYTTSADGLHVHHEVPEMVVENQLPWKQTDWSVYSKVCKSWENIEDIVDELVDPSRHNNPYCARLTDEGDYPAIRCNSAYKTLEFRKCEGTLDFERAEAWIRFTHRFLETALKGEIHASSAEELFKTCRVMGRVCPALKMA